MKISLTQNQKSGPEKHQARVEQNFSTGDGHGDFCLTAYGETEEQARENLRQLALRMVRQLDAVRTS